MSKFKKYWYYFKLKRFLKFSKVKLNFSLKKLTSFKIGGKVDILVEPTNLEDIFKCYTFLTDKHINFFILGNGTNILASSKGFRGVIIKLTNNFSNIYRLGNYLRVESGANLNSVITYAKNNGYTGFEDGFGIPGSVGGAVYMNASSLNYLTSNMVTSVLAIIDGKVKLFSNTDCQFGYRKSIFQSFSNPLILYVEFKLQKGNPKEIKEKMLKAISFRQQKQPKGNSAGSVFKQLESVNISKLIDELGFKGYTINGAKVSDKHANFILNNKNATSLDVSKIIEDIKDKVKSVHNIELETEIKYIGEKNGFW